MLIYTIHLTGIYVCKKKKKKNKKSFKFFILKEMILGAGFVCCFIQIDLYFLFDIIFPVAFNK